MISRDNKFNFNIQIPASILATRKGFLGQGSYGAVHLATLNSETVAVKTVTPEVEAEMALSDEQSFVYMLLNNMLIDILEKLMPDGKRHRNVHNYFGCGMVTSLSSVMHIFYVTEWMPNGDLSRFIHHNDESTVSMQQKLVIAHGVARGLAYIHRKGLVHADFKSENILLDHKLIPKVADFDCSIEEGKLRQYAGSLRWMAPEVLHQRAPNSPPTDVYSCGTVWWEVFAWKQPLKSYLSLDRSNDGNLRLNGKFMSDVDNGVHDPMPSGCSVLIVNSITAAWSKNPAERPTAQKMRTVAKHALKVNGVLDNLVQSQSMTPGK